MARKKINITDKEMELKRIEELNKRQEEALKKKAELIQRERELDELSDTEEPDEETISEAPSVDDELVKVLSQVDKGGTFGVTRITEEGRTLIMGQFPLTEFPFRLEELARHAGGGTFKITVRDEAGHYVKQFTQSFDPIVYSKKEDVNKPNNDLINVLSEVQKQNMATLQTIRSENLELMKMMISAMSGNKSSSLNEILTLAQALKSNSPTDGVEALLKGLEIGRNLNNAEPPSSVDRMIEKIGAPIAEALIKNGGTSKVNAPISVPKNIDNNESVKSSYFYKLYVPKFIEMARANNNPSDAADIILDSIPAIYHEEILKYAERPDLVEFLSSYEKEALTHASWLREVAKHIISNFTEEDETDVPEKVPLES